MISISQIPKELAASVCDRKLFLITDISLHLFLPYLSCTDNFVIDAESEAVLCQPYNSLLHDFRDIRPVRRNDGLLFQPIVKIYMLGFRNGIL